MWGDDNVRSGKRSAHARSSYNNSKGKRKPIAILYRRGVQNSRQETELNGLLVPAFPGKSMARHFKTNPWHCDMIPNPPCLEAVTLNSRNMKRAADMIQYQ